MKYLRGATDTGRALRALFTSTVLFRVRGNRAVSTATAAAIAAPRRAQLRADEELDLWRTHRALRRAIRMWPLPVRCLQASLTIQRLCLIHGIEGAVQVGVWRDDPARIHAWFEVGGFTLDYDGPAGAYAPFELDPREAGDRS